jgi:hypothetical protein
MGCSGAEAVVKLVMAMQGDQIGKMVCDLFARITQFCDCSCIAVYVAVINAAAVSPHHASPSACDRSSRFIP